MTDSSSASVPNPFTSLFWFFVITTIYFVFKYNNSDKVTGVPDPTNSKIYGGIYILLLIIGEFIINLNLTDSMCGTKQYDTALFITIIPWVVIFGLLYVVLSIFPGWLSPFSNTFGYGIAKLSGLTSFLNFILKNTNDLGKETDDKVSESLQHIYSDKSLLINEITQSNFPDFWTNMKSIFKPAEYAKTDNKVKLLSFVRLKDIVSEYIWYMLTGTLITSVSYNYVVNKGCSSSVKEMKKRRKAYNEKLQKKQAEQEVKPKVYSTTE
jgi:hypothetical protein